MPWAQRLLAPERVWPLATGAGVTVAVIDSGVDATAPQLAGRVDPGRDYLYGGANAADDCVGHGTGVASVIAAQRDPRTGFRGLAPGARVLPLRVSEQELVNGETQGKSSAAGLINAIRYAADNGAKVINLSLTTDDSPELRAAVDYATGKDVLLVAAVGNRQNGDKRVPYPAAYDGVLGVGAVDSAGQRYPESQIGPYVDLVAPGVAVTVAARQSGQATVNGTSFATPFVAGAAALVRQYHPGLSAAQVAQRLIATADPAPGGRRSDAYGYGVVSPYRAVTDLTAVGTPRADAAVPPVSYPPDHPERDRRQRLGVALAAGGVLAAGVLAAAAAVLPRARRRAWRPGRR
ncbi:type VII secretion-associated serine protease mycosin [Longispora urticae]